MRNLYIVTLKNRDDLNVVAESFEAAARMVAADHGDQQIYSILYIEEVVDNG